MKDNNSKSSGSSSGGGNFDTLKEAAQEESNSEGGDDTPIEVLEEDGLSRQSPKNNDRNQKQQSSRDQGRERKSSQAQNQESTGDLDSADLSGLEERLDKIIEQNARMIEVLESFGS